MLVNSEAWARATFGNGFGNWCFNLVDSRRDFNFLYPSSNVSDVAVCSSKAQPVVNSGNRCCKKSSEIPPISFIVQMCYLG